MKIATQFGSDKALNMAKCYNQIEGLIILTHFLELYICLSLKDS